MRVAVPRHNKSAAPFYPVVSFADHYNRATPTKDHPRLEFATSHGVQFNPFDMAVSDQYLAFDDAYHRLVLYSQKVRLMVQPL
jgi:hypothetical protein